MKVCRVFMTTAMLVLVPALAAYAAEMFSPALPATGTQFLECRIVNVGTRTEIVTIQAFMSTGAPATGPVTQTLAPGEAGGFSVSATAVGVYCKFSVQGSTNNFRASIDVLDSSTSPPSIVVALPAY